MDYFASRCSYSYVAGEEEYILCLADVGNWNLGGTTTEYLKIISDLGYEVQTTSIKTLLNLALNQSVYQRGANLLLAPAIVDCSSLVQWLYSQLGVTLPRYTIVQRKFGVRVDNCVLQEGDLVFSKGKISRHDGNLNDVVGHVGILTEIGTVVHAKNSEFGVVEDSMGEFCKNSENLRGIARILPETEWYTIKVPTRTGIQFSSDLKWKVAEKLKR
ncbi:MAG TPA: NlpC/P60 family protein [Candidatus Doudnabacteria bacterium]|nr:NlpC/P60 family protein [Candidatus Doudnabacteria bacterium]